METIFDDLSRAVQAPQKSIRALVALTSIAALCAVIGIGMSFGDAAADRPQPQKARYAPDPIGDMYPREI